MGLQFAQFVFKMSKNWRCFVSRPNESPFYAH